MLNDLVNAVIKIESNGDPNAVSPAGAQGLMQLMPATGKEWHAKLYNDRPYDPFDPNMNRLIGTAYLHWLIDRMPTVRHALAAYNWGIGNIWRAMRRAQSEKYSNIETLLPQETRAYVGKVIDAYFELLQDKKVNDPSVGSDLETV